MPSILTGIWRHRRAIVLYACLLLTGWLIGLGLQGLTFLEGHLMTEPLVQRIVILSVIAYVVMAAIPFVPGAEIGFALLVMFGGAAAPVVYLGMVGALCLSFLVARLTPREPLARLYGWLGLTRAARLVAELDKADPTERESLILSHFPAGLTRRFVDHRDLLLALAINLPGNSLVGGGGGLAFAAGLSGIYPVWAFVATVALAVAPIPLGFLLLS